MVPKKRIVTMKTTRTEETAEMLNGQPGCCHKEERLPDVRGGGGGGDIHNDGYVDDNGDGAMMMVVVTMIRVMVL